MPHGKLKEEMATHIASLRRYAIALTRNTDEAEDLVQECLSKAIAGADTFRPDADLRVWLFRILHNVHVSGLRRRTLENAVKADAETAGLEAVTEPAQHRHLEVKDVMAALSPAAGGPAPGRDPDRHGRVEIRGGGQAPGRPDRHVHVAARPRPRGTALHAQSGQAAEASPGRGSE